MIDTPLYPKNCLPIIWVEEDHIDCLLSRVLVSNGCFLRELHLESDDSGFVAVVNWCSYSDEPTKAGAGTFYISPIVSPNNIDRPTRFHDAVIRYECKDSKIVSGPKIVYLVHYLGNGKGPIIVNCSDSNL